MMPEPQSDPFSAGGDFRANPHLYDYLHDLKFEPAGTVEMVEGGGQAICTLVKSWFTAETLDSSTFRVNFSDIVELDPYYDLKRFRGLEGSDKVKAVFQQVPPEESDVISRPAPFSVIVTREEGIFPIRLQVVWKITDESDWPFLLFRVRYRFTSDPLEPFWANRQNIPYFQVEAPEPDTRLYYRMQDRQKRTARELAQEGIHVEDELS